MAFAPEKSPDKANLELSGRLSGSTPSFLESTRRIDKFIRDKKFKRAITELKVLSDLLPASAVIYELRATLRFETGDYLASAKDNSEALRLNPAGAATYLTRSGVAYSRLKQFDRALNDLDKAIQIDSHYDLAFYNRGIVFALQGNFEAAIKDFTEALAIDPQYALALCNRGTAYSDIGKLELAQLDLEKALRLDPALADAYNSRGALYFKKGDYDKAVRDFQDAIRINPNHHFARSNLGLALVQKQEYASAIALFEQAIVAQPYDPMLYMQRGYSYALNNDFKKALQDFEKVVELSPQNPVAHNNVGYVAYRVGDLAKARLAWASAVQMRNAPDYAYAGYAVALWKDRQPGAAIRHFEKAFTLNPEWRDDLYETAMSYHWSLDMLEVAQTILVEIYKRSLEGGHFARITVNPKRVGGLPSIRGMRIPVVTVARMMSGGATESDVLETYPELESQDIEEVRQYAQQHADLINLS